MREEQGERREQAKRSLEYERIYRHTQLANISNHQYKFDPVRRCKKAAIPERG